MIGIRVEFPQFTCPVFRPVQGEIELRELLLYVAQTIYDSGTSPFN